MNRSIIPILFFYLIERTVLQGIIPVLPVLATNISHNSTQASIYLSICYVSILIGSLLTDKISNLGVSIKILTLINSIPLCVLVGIIGFQKNILPLTIVTASAYFLIGLQLNFITIMVSHLSSPNKAGQNFGILNNMLLLGTVLGGFIIGPTVDAWGYKTAFVVFGGGLLLSYIPVAFVHIPPKEIVSKTFDKAILTPSFVWLLIIIGIGTMLTQVGRFCIVIDMKDKQMSLSNISYAFAIGTLIASPLPYLYGYLTGKVSNKLLLISTLISLVISFFILRFAATWQHFVSVIFLISIMLYCSKGVCNKICYELFPQERQATAQSWLATANWFAIIFGYGWVGFASDKLTVINVSMIGCVLAIGIVILGLIKFKWKVNTSRSIEK